MTESDQLVAQMEAEVNARIDEASARSVRYGADIALLRDSVAELDAQRTQAEVLNALVARAANFAPRVVLFVVKGASALAWAARGFEDTVGNNAIRGLSISLQADTVLQSVLNSQQTFYGSPDEQSENQLVFSRFGNIIPQRVLAVPLRVRGKSAAVLYADSADRGEGATNVEAIELLVYTAGLVVELVSLRARMSEGAPAAARETTSGALAQQPSGAADAAPPPSSGELPRVSSTLPQAQTASGELHQPSASAPSYFRPTAPPPPPVEPQAVAPPPPEPPPARQPEPAPASRGAMLDEEEKQHNDARRFARLLVSEIKLYNEQKVAEGRRNKDLYDRLKEDIDRSRQMYDKRVTQSVAAKYDYFYDELVNTLAEGDAEKLGSDCPGPVVGV
ncbi:MAG TPA: hypothetical protein VNO14_05880 [Blastocatellia bacterium]|nr:hypothetical protein [Blastocatellia bacterium]